MKASHREGDTNTTTTSRTIRVAIGTAAVLALMFQAAQVRPIIAPHQGMPIRESPVTVARKGTYTPVRPARNVAVGHAVDTPHGAAQNALGQLTQPTPTGMTAAPRSGGFDWTAASIGAGLMIALLVICATAAITGHRHVPRSA